MEKAVFEVLRRGFAPVSVAGPTAAFVGNSFLKRTAPGVALFRFLAATPLKPLRSCANGRQGNGNDVTNFRCP